MVTAFILINWRSTMMNVRSVGDFEYQHGALKPMVTRRLFKTFAIALLFTVNLPGCNEVNKGNSTNDSDWAKDEILLQLSEIRKDMKAMQDEIANLQTELASNGVARLPGGPSLVKLSSEITFGDPEAKLAIVEFTDFQCPYCARHHQSVLPTIKKQLIETGKAKYVMYDFPLGFHAQAKPAAIAARCAGQQDKYWEMHDALFKQQRELGPSLFRATASEMELDEAAFSDCLSDPTVAASVDSNFDYGGQIGVSGTPKFFVGKVKNNVMTDVIVINGAQGFSAFSSAIARLEE